MVSSPRPPSRTAPLRAPTWRADNWRSSTSTKTIDEYESRSPSSGIPATDATATAKPPASSAAPSSAPLVAIPSTISTRGGPPTSTAAKAVLFCVTPSERLSTSTW